MRGCCRLVARPDVIAALEIRVHLATTADLDCVARLWHESAESMDGADARMPSIADLRRRVEHEWRGGWTLLVARCGGEIAGMLAIITENAVLDQLFIATGCQRKGIGRVLFDRAKQELPNGFSLRVASSNRAARQFYSHQGMTLVRQGAHPRSGLPVCFYEWHPLG